MPFNFTNVTHRAEQLLFWFGIYRLILASGLLVLALIPDAAMDVFPWVHQESLQLATVSYLVLAILGLLFSVNEQIAKSSVTTLLITDILVMAFILRYCGGVDSGLGSLILITVGIGGMLLPARQSFMTASAAAIAVVYTELLPMPQHLGKDLVQAALLGVAYFVVTALLQYVGHRVKTSEQLARAQADTILDLRHLNELIVQRMRTGIIVITYDGAIRLLNDSARYLLNIEEKRPFWLNKEMHQRLEDWKINNDMMVPPYQASNELPVVSINFAKLQPTEFADIILFLEDNGKMTQQVQQLKLASLGRLTASIAHEIRNPLGAISHASQLLEEAPGLDPADKRLLSIINNHSQRVNSIIQTILDLSRKRQPCVDNIRLSEFVSLCLNERELQIEQNNEKIEVNLIKDCSAEFDINQIKQVLHNLIENGLRYSELKTGERTLHIEINQHDDNKQYYIDILDDGPGVAEDQIKNLFEPFYTTENSGTGLGLYIAKELCDANRLLLSYVSNRSGGCFRMLMSHAISHPIDE
ncbi:sensor histidine kinase [Reinekea marinisedimentorum]|uniref:histidine kinase n=1 Tax=Reinekea marinisedimentorum TaxID=230495 RepID=A0A4R3HUN5_9GAMM|nr:ATP-binding protein [Reinekea marinisedimentorum]TCS36434.1 two-component system sensor histidine kinase PilS (NtrC family) [Reinekea marinisedimentorum]